MKGDLGLVCPCIECNPNPKIRKTFWGDKIYYGYTDVICRGGKPGYPDGPGGPPVRHELGKPTEEEIQKYEKNL